MSSILLIVESPTKAKTLSKYLGKEYKILSSFGHMFDLDTKKAMWGIDVKNNFETYYSLLQDKKNQLENINKAAKEADLILLASDPDREGEAISWHLSEELKKFKKPIKRVLFKEYTKKAILESIKSSRELDEQLYNAQQARRVIDRIVGFGVSGYLRKVEDSKTSLSAGRTQSVALKLIVEREKEIEEFKPETYYTVTASGTKDKIEFEIKYSDKITNSKKAEKVLESLKSGVKVSKLDKSQKNKSPLPPFDTASLMGTSSSMLGFGSAKTMQLAQALYEKGMITYMRTDSFRVSSESITQARDYLSAQHYALPTKPNLYGASAEAQDAHEAIRPTDINATPDVSNLPQDEEKLYDLIWKRFLASQLKPAIYDATVVTFKSSDGTEFKSHGRILTSEGWLSLFKDTEDKSSDSILPSLEVGDCPKLKNEKFTEKQTKPPSRYSEKAILEELKKRGIGRPSTYSAIVSKIQERNYVENKGKVLAPTSLGFEVFNHLNSKFSFMNYDYTASMEQSLDKIESGSLSYVDFLNNFYKDFSIELVKTEKEINKSAIDKCPKCSSDNKEYIFGSTHYVYCSTFPKCGYKSSYSKQNTDIVASEDKFTAFQSCPKCSGYLRAYHSNSQWSLSCVRKECDGKLSPTEKQVNFYNNLLKFKKG
jgi:DNA topoisomerase-1